MPGECAGRDIAIALFEFEESCIHQPFVEIPEDAAFTVEYSVRAAQMAVHELLGIDRQIPAVTPDDKSLHAPFDAPIKALK